MLDLQPYLHKFSQLDSTLALERSELYRKLQPEIDRILDHVWMEDLAVAPPAPATDALHAVAWNIERGMRADAVTRHLLEHPHLRSADVFLLSELDWGMARTGNRFVARDLAMACGLNYA